MAHLSRVLAIGAHPDDIEFGAGGLIQYGAVRSVLIATHGERGGDAATRAAETMAAMERIGAAGRCRILRHPDTAVNASVLVKDIEAAIREIEPSLILTHSPRDAHQDHAAVCAATMIAARDWSGMILAYCTPSVAERFRPNWFVSLGEKAMAEKVALAGCHVSQASRPYLAAGYLEAAGRYWAQVTRSAAPFVEPYELLRYRES